MPLLWLSLLFIAGILLVPTLGGPALLWLGLAVFFLLFHGLVQRGYGIFSRFQIRNRRIPIHPLLLIFAFLLGGFCYQQTRPVINEQNLAYFNDIGRVQIAGIIIRPADPLDQAILLDVAVNEVVQINDVSVHMPVQGRCLVRVLPGEEYQYGDQVVFTSQLQTPPEGKDFSYRDYLARKGIYSYMLYARLDSRTPSQSVNAFTLLYAFRARAYRTINAIISQPEAGLLTGILIGMERDIPQSVQDDFQTTGTSHIVAISGFNNPVYPNSMPLSHQLYRKS